MAETSFESDRILKLVTDALRAGPGSPEWHQAMAELAAEQRGDLNDYALLCRVREDLESGREYRSVRPGPGFTRKVMEGIEKQAAGQRSGLPSANLIALLAGGLILAVIVVVGWVLLKSPETGPSELAGVQFGTTLVSSDFSAGWPAQWQSIGEKPRQSQAGLQAPSVPRGAASAIGGAVLSTPLEPDRPYLVDVTLGAAAAGPAPAVEVFITDQPPTTNPAGPSRELVVDLSTEDTAGSARPKWDGLAKVMLLAGQEAKTVAERKIGLDPKAARQDVHLSIRVNQKYAIVACQGQEMWRDLSQLSPDRPRFVGVRFVTKPGDQASAVAVQSVRVSRP